MFMNRSLCMYLLSTFLCCLRDVMCSLSWIWMFCTIWYNHYATALALVLDWANVHWPYDWLCDCM